jgi:predicted Zn-dependent peptidase
MGLLDQILLQGNDSLLYQALVQRRGLTGSVSGGINSGLGNMFNYDGPMLWQASLYHDSGNSSDEILTEIEQVLEQVRTTPVDQETLDRAMVKMRSNLYDVMGGMFGFGRADLMASFALFDDDPSRINELVDEFRQVTPELLQRTAAEYLRPTAMTVFTIEPGSES